MNPVTRSNPMNRPRITAFGLVTVLALGFLLALSDAQDGTAAPPGKVEGQPRVPASAQPTGPWAPQQVKLDGSSPTYTYLSPRYFEPPKDGDYTAAVKVVNNYTFKVDVAAVVTRPGAKPAKEAVRVSTKTEKGTLFATFPAKKGTQYNVTVSTTKAVPKGAKAETAFIMLSGVGSKARPVVAERPIEDLFPPGAPKDPFIPIVARLMERHLANVTPKNEFDQAFENVLKQNPKMTPARMATFVKNYNDLHDQLRRDQVRRDHFVEPTPNRPARAPLTREDVRKAIATAHPELAKVEPPKRLIVTPTAKKMLKERPVLNAKVEQVDKMLVGSLVRLSFIPQLDKFDPAPPPNGYKPGDKLTLIGKNFSSKRPDDNQIYLTKPNTGPDKGTTQKKIIPDSATDTQLKFTLPDPLYKGTYAVSVQTPSGLSIKDLPLPVQEAPKPLYAKPVIKDIKPDNMEPGGPPIYITSWPDKPLFKKDPIVIMHSTTKMGPDPFNPDPLFGLFIITKGKLVGDSVCEVEFPSDMVATTYNISVEGGDGSISIMSDPLAYDVKPGRYRIQFDQMVCIHPRHFNLDFFGKDAGWDIDSDLVTTWSSVIDTTKGPGCWAKSSSKHGDIGGGHPPVSYKGANGTEGNLFTDIPGNNEGYQSVRYGLVLTTQLYDWGGNNDEAQELAADIKTYGDAAGMAAGIVYAPVGAVITKIADTLAQAIQIVAKMYGFDANIPIPTYSPLPSGSLDKVVVGPNAYTTGPDKQTWTYSQLQEMRPGEIRPPGKEPYTMKFGYGSYSDWHLKTYGQPALPYGTGSVIGGSNYNLYGKSDPPYFAESYGDWKLTWRIQRAVAGGNVTAP
jgi:hypothetical protein